MGWTHAYDIRMEEAAGETKDTNNNTIPAGDDVVPRTDFFGGKHKYVRDADGLYTPPPYLFDEMDSAYNTALINGLPASLEDIDKGMDGTVKHFIKIGAKADGTGVRACDYIKDRHGNTTNLTYGASAVTMADGSSLKLLQSVTDPSGRTLNFTWVNKGTTTPHWRITQAQVTDGVTSSYLVTYDYETTSGVFQLWKVHLDSGGLNRVTTYTYTTASGEANLLASIADPLGHTVSYTYTLPSNSTGTVWVYQITEPGGVDGNNVQRVRTFKIAHATDSVHGASSIQVLDDSHNAEGAYGVYLDSYGRFVAYISGPFSLYSVTYDANNNVTETRDEFQAWKSAYDVQRRMTYTYGFFGNVLTQQAYGFSGVTTTTYYNASKYFQKASVTDPLGRVTTLDYYGTGDGDTTTANKGEVRWVRDADYAVSGTPSYGKQYTYAYDSYGRKVSETNLNGVVTNYTYGGTGDSWGNLTKVVQDDGTGTGFLKRTTTMTYDLYGCVLTATDPMSRTSTFTYNSLGQPNDAKFRDAASVLKETITYGYGINGRTESVTDNRGTTTMAYEAGSDRVSSVTDPVTDVISYVYLITGERAGVTYPGNRTTTYTYMTPGEGGLEILLPKDDPNALSRRPTRITDADGRKVDIDTTFMGLPRSVRFNQTFDGGGSLTAYCESTYVYDAAGQSGYPLSRGMVGTLANKYWTKTGSTWSSTLLSQNAYTYNNGGQRTQNALSGTAVGTVRTELYGYDDLNRLTTVNYGDGETQTYVFDAMATAPARAIPSAGRPRRRTTAITPPICGSRGQAITTPMTLTETRQQAGDVPTLGIVRTVW